MMKSPTLESDAETLELVARAQSGDTDAFSSIVKRYHRRVVGYIIGLVSDRDMADEIAQEVFLAAHFSLDQFDQRSDLNTWLIGIARNKSITALRKDIARRRREETAGQRLLRAWQIRNAMNQQPIQKVRVEALNSCLQGLQDHHRELLDRHYRDNESVESIANSLERGASGLRMTFMRLRRSLAECVNRELAVNEIDNQ